MMMIDKFEISLDELVDFVLTDKYVNYSEREVNELGKVMHDKLKEILNDDEREFYQGVIEGLIVELTENMVEHSTVINPLKNKYDGIAKRLTNGVSARLEFESYPCIKRYSFTSFSSYFRTQTISRIQMNDSSYLFLNDTSHYKGEGENSDDLLTDLGIVKKQVSK